MLEVRNGKREAKAKVPGTRWCFGVIRGVGRFGT